MISVAFTGHRPHYFVFGYDETHILCQTLKRELLKQICKLYHEKDARVFYSGAALGVDLWGAGAILYLRDNGYPDLKLICAIPYQGHDSKWPTAQRERLQKILSATDYKIIVSESYSRDVYARRNYFMVDCSQYLIAICDPQKHQRSGTMQTLNYAEQNKLGIIYINSYTAVVTDNLN